jgi:hypothetical protein
MNENFKQVCFKNFAEISYEVSKKFHEISSKELEKMLIELIKTEETFIEMEEVIYCFMKKLDKSLNKILINKIAKDLDKQTSLL